MGQATSQERQNSRQQRRMANESPSSYSRDECPSQTLHTQSNPELRQQQLDQNIYLQDSFNSSTDSSNIINSRYTNMTADQQQQQQQQSGGVSRRSLRQRPSRFPRWPGSAFSGSRLGAGSILRRSRRQASQTPDDAEHQYPFTTHTSNNITQRADSFSMDTDQRSESLRPSIRRRVSNLADMLTGRRSTEIMRDASPAIPERRLGTGIGGESSRILVVPEEEMESSQNLSSSESPRRQSPTRGSQVGPSSSEDHNHLLSRLLSVAASATASSLIGQRGDRLVTSRDVGASFTSIGHRDDDDGDNSFDGFLQALENGRLTSVLRNGEASMSSLTNQQRQQHQGEQEGDQVQGQRDNDTDMSRNSGNQMNFFRIFRFNRPNETTEGNTDSAGAAGAAGAAVGGVNTLIPVIIVGIRSVAPREAASMAENATPSFAEAMAGPPREFDGLPSEIHGERNETRPQESSDMSRNNSFDFLEDGDRQVEVEEEEEEEPNSPSSNTNGTNNTADSRSWIIYVLGGAYPPDHPLLTTPSIFTDSPTYDDMIRLSNLLGSVKPPIASEDSMKNAGGIETIGGGNISDILLGERCLICLSDYANGENVRYMHECKHVYHRACIDEWLTTASNTCPLCRGIGVPVVEA